MSRTDLGPVPFTVRLRSRPSDRPVDGDPEGVGLLADVGAAYARGWRGRWSLGIGAEKLELKAPEDLPLLEEFWVLLIELVDSEAGEWSLYDGESELVVEAQVYGPDVNLEFASQTGAPRFRGRRLPDRATVRLRAVVSEGVAFLRQVLDEASRMDPTLAERDDMAGMRADMELLLEAVADLPGTFRQLETSA